MTSLAIRGQDALSDEERERFAFHSSEIQAGIRRGQEARSEVISHVLSVIESEPPLWRENYVSEEEYVKTEPNIEMSSFWRNVKDNKNYLHLVSNTEDIDEQITLSRMRGSAYRELRQIATDNKQVLKRGGESDQEYRARLEDKEKEDAILIEQLWKEIYPRIVRFKESSNTGIYPNGGYSITAKDITETCRVLQQIIEVPRLIQEGVAPAEIPVADIDGEQISLQKVIDIGGDYSSQVLEAVSDLGISEALTQKLGRQTQHIRDSLEKKYHWDQYPGILMLKGDRLVISNQSGDYDLVHEWSDLLGRETVATIRRLNREI